MPPADAEPNERKWFVSNVREDGPAHRAGLRVDDEIISIDGQDVTAEQSYLFLNLVVVKAGVRLTLGLRDGRKVTITTATM